MVHLMLYKKVAYCCLKTLANTLVRAKKVMTMMCFLYPLNLEDQTHNFILLLITFYS